ncbi:DeoR/GlpR family DNA-binding transcription regulator [Actinomycetaceae bacterium L2_0104]
MWSRWRTTGVDAAFPTATIAAATFVPNNGALFIDAGSTTGLFSEFFPNRRLTVFTNTLSIATTLANLPAVTVHTLGGKVRPVTLAEVGPQTIEVLNKHHFDMAFVGTNSLSLDRGLATPDTDEAAIKAAMIRNSERTFLLADHSKFAQTSLVTYAAVEEVDVIVTGNELGEQHRAALEELDVEVIYT